MKEDLFGKFDRERADAERDASMEQVEEHADEEWKEVAYDTIIEVASMQFTLTADDVQMRLEDKPVHTHELRALGPLMLKAAREGYIVQTGEFTRSTQVQCHSMPRRVWQSQIYNPNQ